MNDLSRASSALGARTKARDARLLAPPLCVAAGAGELSSRARVARGSGRRGGVRRRRVAALRAAQWRRRARVRAQRDARAAGGGGRGARARARLRALLAAAGRGTRRDGRQPVLQSAVLAR